MPLTPVTQADSELERLLRRAPTVRFISLEIAVTGVFALGCALNSRCMRIVSETPGQRPNLHSGAFSSDRRPEPAGLRIDLNTPMADPGFEPRCLGHPLRADSSIAPSPPSSHTTPRCCERDGAPAPVLKRANFWLRGGLWCLHRLYDRSGLWYHRLRLGNFFFECADRFSEQGNRPLLVL